MILEVTWESLVFAGTILGAIVAILKYVNGGVSYLNTPKKNEQAIEKLSVHHEDDMREMRDELRILTYGILACLKGQKEQGLNGPVSEAIIMIEKHLNKKAHE